MEIILSLAFKNNSLRFIEFLPRVDFGLSLDIGNTSLGGDGPKREQTDIDVKIDELKSATQAASSSGWYLDDLLTPDGIGTLEQISYHVKRKKAEPQIAVLSYLFFDRQPNHFFPNANPAYPFYAYLALRKLFPYNGRYKTIAPAAEYFSEAPYEPIGSPKYLTSMNYPLVHITLLEQFDPAKEIYNKASLFAPRLKMPTGDVYVSYAKDSSHYSQPKPETSKLYNGIPKISLEIQEINPIPQNPATLEENVRNIYRLQSTPRHEIYDANLRHQMQISIPHNPIQQTQAFEPRIESRVRAFFAEGIYQEPDAREAYAQNQTYGQISQKNPVNPREKQYTGANQPQQDVHYKIGTSTFPRNYDMPFRWVNVMGSNFWRSIPSLYIGEANYTKPQTKEIEDKSEIQEKAVYERSIKQRTDDTISAEESLPKPEYEANKKNQTDNSGKSDKGIKSIYKSNKESNASELVRNRSQLTKNPKAKRRSVLSYLGVAAGVGLLGLATLAYPLASIKSREIERPNLYFASSNKITNEPQKTKHRTIDSVFEPPINNGAGFTPGVKDGLELLLNEARQLYGSVVISVENHKTGKHYDNGGGNEETAPCLNKVPLAFIARYLAEQGRLNLNKKIKFDKGLALEWEVKKNPNDFYESAILGYERLEELMMTISSNTAYNHILKLIAESIMGKGADSRESFPIINGELSRIGLYSTKIKSLHLKDEPYRLNVSSSNDAVKIIRYILTQQYLKDSQVLKKHLSNERPGAVFRELYLKDIGNTDKGTKFTLFEDGTGFVVFAGDTIFAVIYNKPLTEPMYIRDENGEKKPNQIFYKTGGINEKIFRFIQEYLLSNNQSQEQYQQKKVV